MKKTIWTYVLIVLGVAVDFVTKLLIVEHIKPIATYALWQNIVHLTYVENRGAAFGMLRDQQWFFIVVTSIVMVVAAVMLHRMKTMSGWMRASLILILIGGLGNFIDRVTLGYVVDFVELRFINFAVFNVADSCITIGAIMMGAIVLFQKEDVFSVKAPEPALNAPVAVPVVEDEKDGE